MMTAEQTIIVPTDSSSWEQFKRSEKLFKMLYQMKIWKVIQCPNCRGQCKIRKCASEYDFDKYKIGYFQQCKKCHTRYSINNGAYMFRTRVTLQQHLELLYCHYYNLSVKKTMEKTKLDKVTVIKYKKFYRRCLSSVMDEYYKDNKFGDFGICEIDESLGSKKHKHKRGHKAKEKWIGCIKERNTGRIRFLDFGEFRTRDKVIPFIEDTILKSKQIYSDQYSVYLILGSIGYKHYSINHKYRFSCPYVDGAHTNGVEGENGLFKVRFSELKGCNRKYLQIYLDEIAFRRIYAKSSMGLFNEMLLAIGRMQHKIPLE
eukprot:282993_1